MPDKAAANWLRAIWNGTHYVELLPSHIQSILRATVKGWTCDLEISNFRDSISEAEQAATAKALNGCQFGVLYSPLKVPLSFSGATVAPLSRFSGSILTGTGWGWPEETVLVDEFPFALGMAAVTSRYNQSGPAFQYLVASLWYPNPN